MGAGTDRKEASAEGERWGDITARVKALEADRDEMWVRLTNHRQDFEAADAAERGERMRALDVLRDRVTAMGEALSASNARMAVYTGFASLAGGGLVALLMDWLRP